MCMVYTILNLSRHNTTINTQPYRLIMYSVMLNRQARAALGDRRKYSLQLTALRLNPSRLLGVQALTLHNP